MKNDKWQKIYFDTAMEYYLVNEEESYKTYKTSERVEGLKIQLHKTFDTIVGYQNMTSLFRYNSFQNWEKWDYNLLSQNKLYLTPIKDVNDPFEVSMFIDSETFIEDSIKCIPVRPSKNELDKVKSEHSNVLNCILKEAQNAFSIKCFCEEVDNLLLWAHYANSHTGYCIEYHSTQLFEMFQYRLLPVIYQDDLHKLTFSNIPLVMTINSLQPIVTKSKHWEYEKEWRIYKSCGNKEEEHKISVPKPKSVYLGCNTCTDNMQKMMNFCQDEDITLYKMIKSHTKYALEKELLYKGEC